NPDTQEVILERLSTNGKSKVARECARLKRLMPRVAEGRKVGGKFCERDVFQSQRGVEQARPPRSGGFSRANVYSPRVPAGNRELANAGADRGASSDQDGCLFRALRSIFKTLLPFVVQN